MMFHVFRSFNFLPLSSSIRCHGTRLTRVARRVLTEDGRDYNEVELGLPPDPSTMPAPKPVQRKQKPKKKRMTKKVPTDYGFINSVISATSKSLKNINNKDGLVLLEGIRLIKDAVDAGAEIKTIYYSEQHNFSDHPDLTEIAGTSIPVIKVAEDDYKLVSKQVTPSGFMALCKKPAFDQLGSIEEVSKNNLTPLVIVADSFSDPGNLGTLIRSTAGVGSMGLLCSKNCALLWEPKVLRAGSGSHFRLPIMHNMDWTSIYDELTKINARLFYAEASQDQDSIVYNYNFFSETSHSPLALLIGSEANGFNFDAKELIHEMNGEKLSIPLSRGVESLNNHVSAAIIMYEMRRQYISFTCNKR